MSIIVEKMAEKVVGAKTHKFRLPIPPTANLIWRNNYTNGSTYKNPKYTAWQKEAQGIVGQIEHKLAAKWDLDVRFFFYYVNKTSKMDLDNRIKPLVDLFRDCAKIDDRYLMKVSAERVDVKTPKSRKDHFCECVFTVY